MSALTPMAPAAPISDRPEAGSRRRAVKRQVTFLREFVKAPHVVAAVAPSSAVLARRMIDGFDFRHAELVVEYGPGTGTFTKAVLSSLPDGWLAGNGEEGHDRRFIAIEFNSALADILRERYAGVCIYNDDAGNVLEILRAGGRTAGSVDCVISGLGWPSFSDEQRTRILEATYAALKPGGEFRTFGYHVGLLMRGAWHFRSEVRRLFREVHISRVVWRNAPPAFVYRCVK